MREIETIDFKCALKNYMDYWEHHIDRDLSDYEVVKLALEKQIPKKPKKEFNGMESLALCECGADIYSFPSNFKGCPYCLQAIDWSGV